MSGQHEGALRLCIWKVLQLYVWSYSLHANIQSRTHAVLKSWISYQSSKWQRAQKKLITKWWTQVMRVTDVMIA